MSTATAADAGIPQNNNKVRKPIANQEHESFNSPLESPTEFYRFQQLPVEIRELIYEQAMLAGDHLGKSFGRRHGFITTQHFPAVCFTSRREGNVAAPILIRHLSIMMCCDALISDLHQFLSSLPDKRVAYSAITDLTLDHSNQTCFLHQDFPSTYDLNRRLMVDDVYLLRACPNLQSLTVSVTDSDVTELGVLISPLGSRFGNMPSRERVVEHFHFHQILECKNLNKLTLFLEYEYGILDEVEPVVERMRDVAAWLVDDFERRNGTKMEVEFCPQEAQSWR